MDGFYTTDTSRRKVGKCGKVCFDKKSALTKKNMLLKSGKEKYLRIYNCELCNAWHLTKLKEY